MSEPDSKANGSGDEQPAAATAGPPESGAAPAAAPDPLEEAKADAARYRDQLLRTAADFDNFRKRTRRDLEDAMLRGREGVVKDLLPVFDNLERAGQAASGTTEAKAVADGVRMVLKQFTDTLEKVGISRVATVGAPFDPTVHEAIQHVESAEHAAGVVTHEVQAGYKLGTRLIRAAMVVVSRGPAASAS